MVVGCWLLIIMTLLPTFLSFSFRTHLGGGAHGSPCRSIVTSLQSAVSNSGSFLPPPSPGTSRVVLMRHGEREFNTANIFTGWCDVALTPRGVVEADEAGKVFLSNNLKFRACYTSLLSRSISTAWRSLGEGWRAREAKRVG